jgi:general secretion pathway protein K
MTRLPAPAPRSRSATSRGATLLLAVTAIAILTAAATDLAYNIRVSLQVAANGRDELRATYLAKSALNLSRLVLYYQQQLNKMSSSGQVAQAASQSGLGALAGGMSLNLRLWEIMPVNSSAVAIFMAGTGRKEIESSGENDAAAGTSTPFGDFEGSFEATTEDEDSKINVSQFAGLTTTNLPAAQLLRLDQLLRDPVYDVLFDREDANGVRVSRKDLVIGLKDWVDEDETASALSGNVATPFEEGFGDENLLTSRGSDPYKVKNARFDSLDELYLVPGVSDAFMAVFGDKLTVYPGVNQAIDINTNDPAQLLVNVLAMSDPPGVPQPPLLDPAFPESLQAAIALLRPLPFMPLKVKDFASALTTLGIKVSSVYTQANSPNAAFTDRPPTTFRIRATGRVGAVEKTIDAVVSFDANTAGAQASDLGRLIHWREE